MLHWYFSWGILANQLVSGDLNRLVPLYRSYRCRFDAVYDALCVQHYQTWTTSAKMFTAIRGLPVKCCSTIFRSWIFEQWDASICISSGVARTRGTRSQNDSLCSLDSICSQDGSPWQCWIQELVFNSLRMEVGYSWLPQMEFIPNHFPCEYTEILTENVSALRAID